MQAGESTITIEEHATCGPVRIAVHQPSTTSRSGSLILEARILQEQLNTIIFLLEDIKKQTRPRNLWERIKIWLGIHLDT